MISTGKAVAVALAVAAGVTAFLATPSGRGRGRRGHHAALSRWLALSPERAQAVREADPDFEQDVDLLTANLQGEREKLADLLDDPTSPNEQVMERVERVILAHNALERRVASHVLVIRPHLTAEQQKQLMGLCASGVRRAAGRPRHGRSGDGGGRGGGPGGRWRDDEGNGGRGGQGQGGRGQGGRGGGGRGGGGRGQP